MSIKNLIETANEIGRTSNRPGAPVLTETASAEQIGAWLQWCDANGCHTAELAELEGFDPYTQEDAIEALQNMVNP